jgi:intracellular sulfur oxidation DsrE/DsrF family protein
MEYDVEFVACRNTMETMNWKEEEFIDDLRYVQAGLLEVIEKQVEGFININPY